MGLDRGCRPPASPRPQDGWALLQPAAAPQLSLPPSPILVPPILPGLGLASLANPVTVFLGAVLHQARGDTVITAQCSSLGPRVSGEVFKFQAGTAGGQAGGPVSSQVE